MTDLLAYEITRISPRRPLGWANIDAKTDLDPSTMIVVGFVGLTYDVTMFSRMFSLMTSNDCSSRCPQRHGSCAFVRTRSGSDNDDKFIYIARRELCRSEKALCLSEVFRWFHFVDRFYTLRNNADAVCWKTCPKNSSSDLFSSHLALFNVRPLSIKRFKTVRRELSCSICVFFFRRPKCRRWHFWRQVWPFSTWAIVCWNTSLADEIPNF